MDELPYIIYSEPSDPDTTHRQELKTDITCIGRLSADKVDPPTAGHIQLKLATVSQKHAKIIRTDSGYELHNWKGRYGIGLYERELMPGESHMLAHCDNFRIPNWEKHVRLMFFNGIQTESSPLHIERLYQKVYIFGSLVDFIGNEYDLIEYLHKNNLQVCEYSDLIEHLWGTQSLDRKNDLEALLVRVRKKISQATNGFTFMYTIRGKGICMVV